MYTIDTIKAEIAKRISAESSREINLDSANMEQKIAALKTISGKSIEDETEYVVKRTIKRDSYKTAAEYAAAVLPFVANNSAKVAEISAILVTDNKAHTTDVAAKVKGKNLTQKQIISVLSEGIKTEGEKIKVDVLGGSNFIELLKYVHGLNDEEFTKLISVK